MDIRLEEFLGRSESRAAPVYEKLISGSLDLAAQSRIHFSEFLALLYTRTTAVRRMAGEMLGQAAQIHSYAYASHPRAFSALTERLEREKDKKIPPELQEKVRQAMLDPRSFRLEISKEATLMALQASDSIAPIFFRMKWSLVEPLHGYFITSDNPVVRQVKPGSFRPGFGDGGFTNRSAEVTFPLSPRLMLLLSWSKHALDRGSISRASVEGMNSLRAINSERYLFAHIQDKRIAGLASRFKSHRPQMVLTGYGPPGFAPVSVARRSKKGRPTV